jgi:ribonuclease HII
MPWVVGVDEAGYGPNLGPLVMTAVACRVPEEQYEANLWRVLRGAVRRASARADERLLVEDSKLVYSPTRGLLELERGVLAVLGRRLADADLSLAACVERLCPAHHDELRAEAWYVGHRRLPVVVEPPALAKAAERFHRTSAAKGVEWGPVRSAVVCAPRFNALVDRWDSKGAVLAEALAELLRGGMPGDAAEAVTFLIDKHGGRNTYAAMLQNALPDGMVVAQEESAGCSVYLVWGLGREVRFVFQPRADAEHFGVALASMVSKYLRELFMLEFNRFWQTHVPGLKPTAGYPGDAARFFDEIRCVLERLVIREDAVWRRR